MNRKAVAIVSGGMDSVTLAYYLDAEGFDLTLVSFNYGQRHKKELWFAEKAAEALGADHHTVDLLILQPMLAGSSLTSDDVEVPDGHYAEETMRQTVVPNRNGIMLNIAAGLAISKGASYVATGVHGGDHYIYPDCRPNFIKATSLGIRLGTEGFHLPEFEILAPFVDADKAQIARIGDECGVPWEMTWSCYKGGEIHCGSCGTCFERREAFLLADVHDPTEYLATPDYADPR